MQGIGPNIGSYTHCCYQYHDVLVISQELWLGRTNRRSGDGYEEDITEKSRP